MTALRKTFGQFVKTFANVFDASFILILYYRKEAEFIIDSRLPLTKVSHIVIVCVHFMCVFFSILLIKFLSQEWNEQIAVHCQKIKRYEVQEQQHMQEQPTTEEYGQ